MAPFEDGNTRRLHAVVRDDRLGFAHLTMRLSSSQDRDVYATRHKHSRVKSSTTAV